MKKALILILIAALAIALCACFGAKPSPTTAPTSAPSPLPAAADTQTAATAAASQNPADALAYAIAGNAEPVKSWPADQFPPELPEFTYGTFNADISAKAVVSGVTTYVLCYTGVTKTDVDSYGATLAGNGFSATASDEGGMHSLVCQLQAKDGTATAVSVTLDDKGNCAVAVAPNVQPAG